MMRSPMVLPLILGLAIIASGVALVYARHQTRVLFIELQTMRVQEQKATDEWGRLQLELATQGTLEQVLHRSTEALEMQVPRQTQTIAAP